MSATINMPNSIVKYVYYESVRKEACDAIISLKQKEFFEHFPSRQEKGSKGEIFGRGYFTIVQNYCKLSKKSNYKKKVEYATANSGRSKGRLYAESGLQNLCCSVRKYLTTGIYFDYDMKNAHPNIMLKLCKERSLPCEYLTKYCNNREDFLCENDITKMEILQLCNKDKPQISLLSPEVQSLVVEMVARKKDLFKEFEKEFEYNTKKGNPISSCINMLWCVHENRLLQNALRKVPTESIGALMFDGFMCSVKVDPSIFDCSDMNWAEKENQSDLEIKVKKKEKENLNKVVHKYCIEKCRLLNVLMSENTVKERIGSMQVADILNQETGQPLSKKMFIEKIIFKQDDDDLAESMSEFCFNPKNQKELIETFDNSVNYEQLYYDKNVISFKNGYLNLSEISFYEYDPDVIYKPSKAHFDKDFDISYLEQNWDDIDAGDWDLVQKYQFGHDPDLMLCLNGAIGRLHSPILKHDSFNFMLVLKGASGSGKSTLFKVIEKMFINIRNISTKETTFSLMELTKDPDLIMDTDAPSNWLQSFGEDKFQKYTCGETIDCAVKGQGKIDVIPTAHVAIAMNKSLTSHETAGEVSGRIMRFDFKPIDSGETRCDLHIPILKEKIDAVLVKTLKAYKALRDKYGSSSQFRNWDIEYFKSQRELNMDDNQPINNYFSDNQCAFEKDETFFVEMSELSMNWKQIMEQKIPNKNDTGWGLCEVYFKRLHKCKLCDLVRDTKYDDSLNCQCLEKSHENRGKTGWVACGIKRKETKSMFDTDEDEDDL
jgi:phage/plasmid-associated DNA primase